MKFNDTEKSQGIRERMQSNDSDDSDDEIIVKTLFPVDKAVSLVENPDSLDLQQDSQLRGSADNKDGDEVIEKVVRRRMPFPCSSQGKASPKSSGLNSSRNLHECDNCSHQEPNDSKTKPELLDEKKSSSKNDCAGKEALPSKSTTSCHLS